MHRDAFAALLARSEDLEREHQSWCESINEGGDYAAYARARRDQTYRELTAVQEQIDAEIQTEKEQGL